MCLFCPHGIDFSFGCLQFHAVLYPLVAKVLPLLRGSAGWFPRTGISIMAASDAGLYTGDVLLMRLLAIDGCIPLSYTLIRVLGVCFYQKL